MAYMSDGMKMSVQLAGFGKTFGRLAGGGSLFQITYTNESQVDGYVAMTPDYPGVIVPINMQSCPSGRIVAMRDSFLCATVGLGGMMTDVGAGFNPANSVGAFCCSGVDFIVQVGVNLGLRLCRLTRRLWHSRAACLLLFKLPDSQQWRMGLSHGVRDRLAKTSPTW